MIPRETWARLIKDFAEFELPELVPRDIQLPPSGLRRAVAIVGPRRAGKTFLMYQIMGELERERTLYVDLESDMLVGCGVLDLRVMLDVFYELYPENAKREIYLFLDEVQNVPGWERFVRTLLASGRVRVFVSGSSSKMLSREIATALRGRSLSCYIYPFSFREYLRAKGVEPTQYPSTAEKAKILKSLADYISGSYPEAVMFEPERERILREILEVTIYRDIVERFKVKNVGVLKLLLRALLSSTYFSVHKFYNYLKSTGRKVSKNTLYEYLEYFSDSLILFPLRKYSPSYKDIEQSTPKIYPVDNGLCSVVGVEDRGRFMEQVVFLEFVRRGLLPNSNLFYVNTRRGEVDFALKHGRTISELVQVCYGIEDMNTRERELGALVAAGKGLDCRRLRVITWDQEETVQYGGRNIKLTPLWKWLLGFG